MATHHKPRQRALQLVQKPADKNQVFPVLLVKVLTCISLLHRENTMDEWKGQCIVRMLSDS